MPRIDAKSLQIILRGAAPRAIFLAALASPILGLAASGCPVTWREFVESWRVFDWIALQRLCASLALTAWTLLFATAFAAPVYVAYQGLPVRVRRWIVIFSLAPLSFPTFGVASGWLTLISRIEQINVSRLLFEQRGILSRWLYTQPGGGFLLALCFWPILFLTLALSSQPRRSQVEAARLCMTRRTAARRVLWPAWREPLLAAASVVACLGLLQFETPSLLQLTSYPLEIFTRFSIPENEWKAVILCAPYAVLALFLAWAFRRAGRCLDLSVTDPPFTAFPQSLRNAALFFTLLIFFLSIVIPLLSLLLFAGSHLFTREIFTTHMGRLARSLCYSGIGAAAIVLSGIVYCSSIPRRGSVFTPALLIGLFACPGILIASGWLQLRSFWPGALPPAVAIASLIGAYTTHWMLAGYTAGILLWKNYGERQREFETLLGLDFITRLRRLYWPALRRPAAFVVALTALLLWGDVGITILLHPPGGDTLAVEYFNLLHYGNEARTAAIGVLLLAAPAAVVSAILMLSTLRRKA